ncbi:plant cysteine oxidase 2-like isoform X2 [Phragmites australis]|uniref:plant cysteine oxidase 2-like isoform X2 n=1 Tax=Phragmites australis TaxID=29695 RepID=UPI002D7A3E37|nr:plant cysteine oxidase 2-like isoform X2 [Phragmites australis]
MKVERGAGGVEVEVVAEPAAAMAVAAAEDRAAKRRRVAGGRRAGGGGGVGRRARTRRVQAGAAAMQRLFQACRAVFRGPGTVPAPGEVHLLRAMLDRMKPEDVDLSPDLKFFRTRDAAEGTPTITQTTIYKCPNFSMVIFFLPPNAVIPLHNHPGMTVFSKLLLGSMHIKSYDWVDPDPDPSMSSCSSSSDDQYLFSAVRLAKVVVDDVFTAPCNTSVLYPTAGGNMHRFRAIVPCAILDILGPPYSIEEDRDCTYYTDIPYTHHSTADGVGDLTSVEQDRGRLAWLKEIDMPGELKMCSVHYGGPPISDK